LRDRSICKVASEVAVSPETSLADLRLPPSQKDLERLADVYNSVKNQILLDLKKYVVSTYLSLKAEEPALTDPDNRKHLRKAAQLVLKKYNACSDLEPLVKTIWGQVDNTEVPEKLRTLVEFKQILLKGYALEKSSTSAEPRVDINGTSYDLVVSSLDCCANLSEGDFEAAQDQFALRADGIAIWLARRVPVIKEITSEAEVSKDFTLLLERKNLPVFIAPEAEIKLVAGQELEAKELLEGLDDEQLNKPLPVDLSKLTGQVASADQEASLFARIRERFLNKIDPAIFLIEEFLSEHFPKVLEFLAKASNLAKKLWSDATEFVAVAKKVVQKQAPDEVERERLKKDNLLIKLAASIASNFAQGDNDTLDRDSFSYRRCQSGGHGGAKDYSVKSGRTLSKDAKFAHHLHNVSAWIPIDGTGTLRLLNEHIRVLPPQDSEFLYQQLYRVIDVRSSVAFDRHTEIDVNHTKISAKVSGRRTLTLPLAAGYEIKLINFYDRRDRYIPLEKVEVEVCRLGSFKVVSPVGAKSISYLVAPIENQEVFQVESLKVLLPRIKTFLPLEDRIVEKTIIEEEADLLKRAVAWLSYEFIANKYIYSQDPFVARLFRSVGDARIELISALKMGICDNLSFYVATRLRRIGVPAFVLTGPSYENREFSYDPGHSVVGIITEQGLTQFDVTKLASEHYKNDYAAKTLTMRERRAIYYSLQSSQLRNEDVYAVALRLNYTIAPRRSSNRFFANDHIAAQRYISDASVSSLQEELGDVFEYRTNHSAITKSFDQKACSAILAICQQRLIRYTERERYPLGNDGRFISGIPFNAYSLRFLAGEEDFKADLVLPKDVQAIGTTEFLIQHSLDAIEDPDCPDLLKAFAHQWLVEHLSSCTEPQLQKVLDPVWLENLRPEQSLSLIKKLPDLISNTSKLKVSDLGMAGFVLESESAYQRQTFAKLQFALAQLTYQIDASEFNKDPGLSNSLVSASIQALAAVCAERERELKGDLQPEHFKATLSSSLQMEIEYLEDQSERPKGSMMIGHILKQSAQGYAQLNYLCKTLGSQFVRCQSLTAVIKHYLLDCESTQVCLENWNFVQRFICEVQAASSLLNTKGGQPSAIIFSAGDCLPLQEEFQARLLPLVESALKGHIVKCNWPFVKCNWPSVENPASSLLVMLSADPLRLSLISLVEMGVLSKAAMVNLHGQHSEKSIARSMLFGIQLMKASNPSAPRRLTLGQLNFLYDQPIYENCTELHRLIEDRNSVRYVVSCLADAYGTVDSRFNQLMRAVIELYEQSEDKITANSLRLILSDADSSLLIKRLIGDYSTDQIYNSLLWYCQHAESFDYTINSHVVSSDAIRKLLPEQGVSTQDGLMSRFLALEIQPDPFGSHLRGLSDELKLRVALAAQLLAWGAMQGSHFCPPHNPQNASFCRISALRNIPAAPVIFMHNRSKHSCRISEVWKSAHWEPCRESDDLSSIYLDAKRRVDTYASRSGKNFAAPLSKYLLSQGAPIQPVSLSGDFKELKSYQPGQRVNWKASAKRGELFVNSYTEQELRDTALLIDSEWLFDLNAPIQNEVIALQRRHVQEVFTLALLAAQQNVKADLVLLFRGNYLHFENIRTDLLDSQSEGYFLGKIIAALNSARTHLKDELGIYEGTSLPAYRQTGIAQLELARDSLLICGMPTQNLVISHDLLDARAKRGAFVLPLKQ
jgi:hypothetical protein